MATYGSMPPSEQARVHHMSQLPEMEGGGTWSGWVTFGATVLILLGCLNGLQGFLALLDDGYFVARSDDLVLMNYDAWGALLVVWGAVLIVLGAALYARKGWARVIAVFVILLDVIIQFGFFPSFPLLSLLLIGLDIVVLYALTARWDDARMGF
jgi:hypothetical protein